MADMVTPNESTAHGRRSRKLNPNTSMPSGKSTALPRSLTVVQRPGTLTVEHRGPDLIIARPFNRGAIVAIPVLALGTALLSASCSAISGHGSWSSLLSGFGLTFGASLGLFSLIIAFVESTSTFKVTVSPTRMHIRKGHMPIGKRVDPAAIKSVSSEAVRQQAEGREYYTYWVNAVTWQGESTTLLSDLSTPEEAQFCEEAIRGCLQLKD